MNKKKFVIIFSIIIFSIISFMLNSNQKNNKSEATLLNIAIKEALAGCEGRLDEHYGYIRECKDEPSNWDWWGNLWNKDWEQMSDLCTNSAWNQRHYWCIPGDDDECTEKGCWRP